MRKICNFEAMTKQAIQSFGIILFLGIQLGAYQIAVAQSPGKSMREDELAAYALRKESGVRISKHYQIEVDERGVPKPQSKTLQRVRHFDAEGYNLTDSLFGDVPGESVMSMRYKYRGNFISEYWYKFGAEESEDLHVRMKYDEENRLRYSLTLEGAKLIDSTSYNLNEEGELISQTRIRMQSEMEKDLTRFFYNEQGQWIGMEKLTPYLKMTSEYEYDQFDRLSSVIEESHYYHDGRDEKLKMTYHYRDDELCRQVNWFNVEGKLEWINLYEYLDSEGKVILP